MDTDQLYLQALQQARQQAYQEDPWYLAGSSILNTGMPDGMSSKDQMLYSIAQGLLGGGLSAYGKRQAEDSYTNFAQNLLGGTNQKDYTGSMKGLYGDVSSTLGIYDQLESKRRKKDAIDAINKATLENPYANINFEVDDSGYVKRKDSMPEGTPSVTIGEGATNDAFGGLPSIEEREKQIFRENLAIGMTPSQASQSARAAVADERKNSLDELKNLREGNDEIKNLTELIQTGEEGIKKAGKTGGPGAKMASLYEWAMSPFSSEAATQTEGDAALERTGVLAAAIKKSALPGALSNYESQMLFKQGMSPNQLNATNESMLKKYQAALQKAKEHESFMRRAISGGKDANTAQEMWNEYSDKNPVIRIDQKGEVEINPNRVSWQQYFSGNKTKGTSTSSIAQTPKKKTGLGSLTTEQIQAMIQAKRGGGTQGVFGGS